MNKSEMNGVAYTTVMHWLQAGKVEGAVKHTTPFGHYWELPEDTPRPGLQEQGSVFTDT
jgi:hypothetical protein